MSSTKPIKHLIFLLNLILSLNAFGQTQLVKSLSKLELTCTVVFSLIGGATGSPSQQDLTLYLNNDGKVIFGSTVDLENLDTGEKVTYKIVGKDEADLQKKLIFFQSPIGRGLIGKSKNDLVEIKTPAAVKNFEIKDVKYL